MTPTAEPHLVNRLAHQPDDAGLLAETVDPSTCTAAVKPSAGFIVLSKFFVPQTITIGTLLADVVVVGAGLTAAQNLAGVYDSTGVLIAATADQSTNWESVGGQAMTLSAQGGHSLTLNPATTGVYYFAAVLCNGTTPPMFACTQQTIGRFTAAGFASGPGASGFTPAGQQMMGYETVGSRTSLVTLTSLTINEWTNRIWLGLE